MTARSFTTAIAALLLALLIAVPAPRAAARSLDPARDEALAYTIGVQTCISGFPTMDLSRTFWETSFDPKRRVITPNNDTIYQRASLDLRAEPIILVIPPMGDRRYWVPVSDMRHDFDANLSWDVSRSVFCVAPMAG